MLTPEQISAIRKLFFQQDGSHYPHEVLQMLYEQSWFKMFVPRKLNGLELPLPEAAELLEQLAYADGDLGWSVQIGAGGGFFTAFASDAVLQRYFTAREFVIAGSGMPSGDLKPVKEGFTLSGSWRYCSGSTYASLYTFAVQKDQEVVAVAVDPEDVSIIRNWDAYGMCCTESHTVRVENIALDQAAVFSMSEIRQDFGYALYRLPFEVFAKVCVHSVMMGCFSHLLECAGEILRSEQSADRRKALSKVIESASRKFDTHRSAYYSSLNSVWSQVSENNKLDPAMSSDFQKKAADHSSIIREQAYRLFQQLGMTATKQSQEVNKVWRDLTTAGQHMFA